MRYQDDQDTHLPPPAVDLPGGSSRQPLPRAGDVNIFADAHFHGPSLTSRRLPMDGRLRT
eukprot:4646118-Pyramimonas_sp.AAC.1